MRSNYKKLGQFIEEVNVRNKDLSVERLLGVSIQKLLIPSIANTVGTDMSRYKVVRKNQFAYGPVTSRNGEKISIALLEDYESAIISQSYKVFKIIDEQKLAPEYLMMWFRRPEFDRYARFMSHGSTRETFDWSELCETELPVPSIEKQREIVTEYNVVKNRIKLNDQLNLKLEETAQALYKHWFVDFEFPYVTSSGVEMPYKSSGGAMVYNEELNKEIPEGWEDASLLEVLNISGGGTPKTQNPDYWNGNIPFFTPKDVKNSYYTLETEKSLTETGLKNCSSKLYSENTIFITARGTVGAISLAGKEMAMNQSCYAFIEPNDFAFYGHQLALLEIKELMEEAVGAVFSALVKKDFQGKSVIDPPKYFKKLFNSNLSAFYSYIKSKESQNIQFHKLKNLLFSRMARLEEEKMPLTYER